MSGEKYSIIVPICNESSRLPQSLPALLSSVGSDNAKIICVCNGCTDNSADIARQIGGPLFDVLEIPGRSKTQALNAGDESAANIFPRFYVDADVTLQPGDFATLASVLEQTEYDLVSPFHDFDFSGGSRAARAIGEIWLSLPHVKQAAFQAVLGVSAKGRKAWGRFPELIADDMFIASHFPADRKKILTEVTLVTRPPESFLSWVRVRARWLRSDKEFRELGFVRVPPPEQRAALLSALVHPRTFGPAVLFILARLFATVLNTFGKQSKSGWSPER